MKFLKDVTFFIRNGASIKQRKGCSGIPITRIETISNGRFNYDHLGYADIFDSDTYKKYYLKDNDVLFSHINSEKFLGRTVLYHPKNKTENIIHGMNLLCLRFNQSEYSPEFFYWYSKSSTAKEFYRINTKHAVNQASIPSSAIKEMPIPDFTLNKQYTIVHSLNQIQSSIDYKLDQITKLDSLVKSRFMEMFGNYFEDSRYFVKVGDIATATIGLTYKPNNVADEGIIVLRSGNIKNAELCLSDDIVRVSNIKIKEDKFVRENDILMCSRNGSARLIGKCCLIPKLNEQMSYGAFMTVIRSKCPYFLNGFFNSSYFLQQLTGTQTASVNQITTGMLNGYTVIKPRDAEESEFAKFCKLVDKSRFVVHSRYFLWLNFTFVSSTIAYSRVVSILECPKRC